MAAEENRRRPPGRGPMRGPVRSDERSLAPDLARGAMLLLIVASNTVFYLWAARVGPTGWHPVDGGPLDTAVQFAMITGLDLRVFPLFAFMFGYGMMRLYQRQTEAGTEPRTALALLRRRGLWLLLFGFAHAALLMAGDIVGLYGILCAVLGTLFIRRGDRTLLIAAGTGLALLAGLTALTYLDAAAQAAAGTVPEGPTSAELYASPETDLLAAALTRVETWAFSVTLSGALFSFSFHAAILLGFWAARRGVLDRPGDHLPLLRRTAVAGIAIGWAGGLPAALFHVGALDLPAAYAAETGPVFMLQVITGLPGGLGYAAAITLAAHAMPARVRGSLPVALTTAVGKRSLSCYLAHSVLFSPVLAAWGLGLGAHLGSFTVLLYAIGVWLVTAVGAYLLERAGRRGPAEAALRRLVYGGKASNGRTAPVG
ncbi:DUF418 domain-containing protein [Nocardiopsis composta]|uniref:Putative membrane protein YeiB n=1 Tax=Nocardiopsis composta TaxID=157465 RepID=A0A7W8QJ90_9ACTN|nr:DUF418 domain-containing protein [Nocardiopsis composta]MBB5430506.1 putative membrane protein YeiB [Nocardiopsis composta]